MALQQLVDADRPELKAEAQVKQTAEVPLREIRQLLETEQHTKVLANEPAEDWCAREAHSPPLQAEAASSAQLSGLERQKLTAPGLEQAANTVQHRQALDDERARSTMLTSELASAQREIEAQAGQLRKANDEAEQLKQAEAAKSAQSFEQERRRERLPSRKRSPPRSKS